MYWYPNVDKDAIFIDKLAALLEGAEDTSTIFMPHKLSLRALHTRARRSVKKRIDRSLVKKVNVEDNLETSDNRETSDNTTGTKV